MSKKEKREAAQAKQPIAAATRQLVDLDPHWVGMNGERLGLSFMCPHCREQRLAIAFHHRGRELIDDAHIRAACGSGGFATHIWTADGDDFDNLSLSPSVDASATGHWHGFITNGEVR